jgi:16S rRNA processing protein RimM
MVTSLMDQNPVNAPSEFLELGRIADAYGLKGWVKVNPSSADSVLAKVKTWWLEKADGKLYALPVTGGRLHGSTVVALPEGFSDRNQSEALIGCKVWLKRAEFPKPLKDEFYWVDLVGCEVLDPEGLSLGKVANLQDHGAHPILEVVVDASAIGAGSEARLIPFVASIVSKVDLAARNIHVEWRADYFQ